MSIIDRIAAKPTRGFLIAFLLMGVAFGMTLFSPFGSASSVTVQGPPGAIGQTGRAGTPGKDATGPPGPTGPPGVGIPGSPGQPGKDGADGKPGKNATGKPGKDSTVPGPPGADSTIPGPSGAPGKDGADGKNGQEGSPGTDGKDGKDGRGITSAECVDGRWRITWTDDTTSDAGPCTSSPEPSPTGLECPPGWVATVISVHQRRPTDGDRELTVCVRAPTPTPTLDNPR